MTKKSSVKISLKKYTLDAVRYAAYALSGEAFVMVKAAGPAGAEVLLTPKNGCSGAGLKARFSAELADERLRESVADGNRELREFLVLKALSPQKKADPAPDSGLTPAQEKELEDLISQVEKEIKLDAGRETGADPLGITRTWEDKYGGKKHRKK